MKISLITVSYNSDRTIRDTFNSVLNQTYPNIEYIVVDGHSTDGTVDVIKEYVYRFGGRMRWISEPDKGLYDAMNKGILMATGDVVGIINSDDLFCDNDAIRKIVNMFNSDETIDAVYADIFYVAQNDTSKIIRKWITGKKRRFKYGWHPNHPTLYVKKDVYIKYGLFNLNYKLAADFEIMLRFIEKHKINTRYIDEFLVKMRLGGASNRSFKNIFSQNLECIQAFKNNKMKVNILFYPMYRLIPKLLQYL
jgi:glycosyltransferase involved in cell wall biosynthesis